MTSPHSAGFFLCLEISMPITEQQLLQILPNAGPRAGVFVGARHAVPRRSLRR